MPADNRAEEDVPAVTVPQLLRKRALASPALPAQWSLDAKSRQWNPSTWVEFQRRVAALSLAFQERGLRRGERVGIIAPSSARWDWVQLAVLAAGGVVVGLDPHDVSPRLDEMARCSGITVLIAATPDVVGKFAESIRRDLRLIVVLDAEDEVREAGALVRLDDLLATSKEVRGEWDRSEADDTATILFTSGTMGTPKGIAHSHRQLCFAASSLLDAFADIREGSHLACWLPLSNIFQRMVNICAIGRGAQIYYVENPREIMNVIGQVNPRIFIGVPRFYEKLYAGIMDRIAAEPAWKRRVAHWALAAGAVRSRAVRKGAPLRISDRIRYQVAKRLVLQRMTRVMGTQLVYMVSGSAPMSYLLLERLEAIGFNVLEGYALSENTVPVATNTPSMAKLGTVGKPLRGTEVKVAADGEVMVRGPGVFRGYYGEPFPASSFDAEGFLATGDLGEFDSEGFLTLKGRKSEIFKTSTGRRIAPAHLESVLRQVDVVEDAIVVGANRVAPIAVLVVSPSISGAAHAADRDAPSQANSLPGWCSKLRADVVRVVQELPPFERPEGLVVSTRPLSIERGELTSNLKLRRSNIERTFAPHIAELDRRLDAGIGDAWQVADDSDVVLCRL